MIIAVSNQKGGVGKTTTTMNLGVALAKAGARVLLVDGDPQANLTSYLRAQPVRTLEEVYLAKRVMGEEALGELITRTAAGVDLVAADSALSGVEYYLFSRPDKELVLSRFLEPLRRRYDFVFLDTPPSLNLLTLNSLCAADRVLIPVQPEFFSLEGIVKIREAIEGVRARWNPRLEMLGVLPTQVSERRSLTKEVLEALRSELGGLVFKAMIHDSAAVTESSGHGRSVLDYDRSSRGAKDYAAAAEELLDRAERAGFPRPGREGAGLEAEAAKEMDA